MLKRIRDLFSRRGKRPPRETASLPSTGDEAPATATARSHISIHRGPSVVHRPIPVADLDPEAVKILRRLGRFDHAAYLVGGCVRDLLLTVHPKDFDIGTSATPRQVKRLFSNCRIIGRRFRLAHIYFHGGKVIEVATFRARDDGDNGASHPGQDLLIRDDNVFGTAEEDALRRDFTINSLFYDVNSENVIDHADGLGDLRRRLVRTIGDPAIRFREDPIRILRAIRFAARLGFEIEPATLEALGRLRHEILKAATARILEEINRFCRGGAARASFQLLKEMGVFEVILPEFAREYLENPAAELRFWSLLETLDEKNRDGHEVSTGEILSILVLPLIAPEMGWSEDGAVADSRQANVRELTDRYIRPMALRLRASRRDQEDCRQILMALHRMVPVHRARKSAQEAIRRRPCFAEATWILGCVATHYGGEVAEASRVWGELGAAASAPASRRGEHRAEHPHGLPAASDDAPVEKRRGRRRRRSRRGTGEPRVARPAEAPSPVPAPAPTARAQPSPDPELPPPWDDRYFFAALPTASQADGSGDSSDRYGAAALSGDAPTGGQADIPAASAVEAAAPRKRRSRRRGSRRRPPSPAAGADVAKSVPDGEGE